MPSDSPVSATDLVARFLRTNSYPNTLSAFIAEVGLPDDAGSIGSDDDGWTIEKVLEEKIAFDKTVSFERAGGEHDGAETKRWTVPAPSQPTVVWTRCPSNILSVSVSVVPSRTSVSETDGLDGPCSFVATDASRRLNFFDTTSAEHALTASYADLADSPILSCIPLRNGRNLALAGMSGKLMIVTPGGEIVDERKDHTKYAVQVAAFDDDDDDDDPADTTGSYDDDRPRRTWLATAGWDGKVLIYCANWEQGASSLIGEPVDAIALTTIPECIVFVRKRNTGDLILIVSRRDSTYLYYYLVASGDRTTRLSSTEDETEHDRPAKCRYIGKQNLAPHSSAWVAFTPSSLALSPHDPELLAVATSSLPHMKVIIVRLLIPSTDDDDAVLAPHNRQHNPDDAQTTQAAQALADLAIQNREDTAILIVTSTTAPQTTYSTPQVAWRPDGSGVWVNGDDGVVRGMEARTGKMMASLSEGHIAGSKVRSIWAGWVETNESWRTEEWLISGGFDKQLVIWRIPRDAGNL